MNKIIIILVFILLIAPHSIGKSIAAQVNQPYFRVKYEIPKMPAEIASKDAAAKNLAIYKQHLQKNKQLMAENKQQIQKKELVIRKHNEITVNLLKDDRREFIRFKPANGSNRVLITLLPATDIKSGGIIVSPIDISRGGVGLYSKTLKVNDTVPIKIQYGNTEIKTKLKIVSNNNNRVGGKFVNIDEKTSNKLIYLSSMLEADNGLLKTKLAPIGRRG